MLQKKAQLLMEKSAPIGVSRSRLCVAAFLKGKVGFSSTNRLDLFH